MSALFTIDQAAKPPGVLGVSRNDISPGTITLSCPGVHATYKWEVASEPSGVPASITTPTNATTTATLTETGSYIFRMTVDEALPTEDVSERSAGIRLPNSSLPIPALNETIHDNSIDPTAFRGAERKLTDFFKWVDANIGGGGGTGFVGIGYTYIGPGPVVGELVTVIGNSQVTTADATTGFAAHGMIYNITSPTICDILYGGEVTGVGWPPLTPGTAYYLSVAGTFQPGGPPPTYIVNQEIGFARSSTTLVFRPTIITR